MGSDRVNDTSNDLPRICLVTESFWPVVGGLESQISTLSEALSRQGFKQIIVTRRSNRASKSQEQKGAITIYRLRPIGKIPFARWLMICTCLYSLLRRRNEYDVILVGGFRTLGLSAIIASRLARKNCVLRAASNGEMSGEFFDAGLSKFGLTTGSRGIRAILDLRKRLLLKADAMVSISTQIKNEYIASDVAVDKIWPIPNPVDLDIFRPVKQDSERNRARLGLKKTDTVVIYTGRLVRYKGLPLLVEVWKKLCFEYSNCILVLVGGGGSDISNCEADLKHFVSENSLDGKVLFTGDVIDVAAYLQLSDIFVLPTENEAFGISLIEAMACGLPVISTATGGILDILTDEHDGLLIQPGNFEQLYGALRRLIIDAELARCLGKNAIETVRARYSSESVSRKYAAVFRQIYDCDDVDLPALSGPG